MTNKEKQINELTKALQHDLILFSQNQYDTDVELTDDFARSIALTLLSIGYRKESEVVKDVLTELLGDSKKVFNLEELTHYVDVPTQKIYDIAEKYGVKLEVQ